MCGGCSVEEKAEQVHPGWACDSPQDHLGTAKDDSNDARGRAHDQAGVGAIRVQGGEDWGALVQAGGLLILLRSQDQGGGVRKPRPAGWNRRFVRMLYPGRFSMVDHHQSHLSLATKSP